MILAEIGEIGIHKGGAVHLLRPSFYAISKLGTPLEIVQLFAAVHSEHFTKRGKTEQFATALGVLYACSADDCPVYELFGTYTPAMQRWREPWKPGTYRRGAVPAAHVLPLARSLLAHGVVGEVSALPRREDAEPEYQTEFHPREHVATAMAHLGLGEREAWAMTMTGLVLALRSKYPTNDKDTPGRSAPSLEEHDRAMEWADKIDAIRSAQNG